MGSAGQASRAAGRFLLDWAPVLLWMALIYSVSSQPSLPGPSGSVESFIVKKSGHVASYAVLAILTWRAFRWQQGALILALIITALYGASDEWHQSFVPPRDASLRDVLIDTFGGGLGLLALSIVKRRFPVLWKHVS